MTIVYRQEFPQAFEIDGQQMTTTNTNNNRKPIEHYLGCSRSVLNAFGVIRFKHKSELGSLVTFAYNFQCNEAAFIYYVKQKS